jgi:lipoate-protein ligase A
MRVLDTGLAASRWNVAMTAALVEAHGLSAVPDTVRFHRYRSCVLLGKGQSAGQAVDLAYCHRHGIEIARRVTGGGAVYMSPRMLAWDVAVAPRAFDGSLASVTRRICEAVAAGLSRLGGAAHFRAPNDVEMSGRKVSGSSGYMLGRSAVLQGTVLIEDDTTVMAAALRIPFGVLHETMSCLATAIGAKPSFEAVRESITQELARALDRRAEIAKVSAGELQAAETLLGGEIGSEAYVMDGPALVSTGVSQ